MVAGLGHVSSVAVAAGGAVLGMLLVGPEAWLIGPANNMTDAYCVLSVRRLSLGHGWTKRLLCRDAGPWAVMALLQPARHFRQRHGAHHLERLCHQPVQPPLRHRIMSHHLESQKTRLNRSDPVGAKKLRIP